MDKFSHCWVDEINRAVEYTPTPARGESPAPCPSQPAEPLEDPTLFSGALHGLVRRAGLNPFHFEQLSLLVDGQTIVQKILLCHLLLCPLGPGDLVLEVLEVVVDVLGGLPLRQVFLEIV